MVQDEGEQCAALEWQVVKDFIVFTMSQNHNVGVPHVALQGILSF